MGAQRSMLAPGPRFPYQPMPQNVRDMHLAVMQNDVPKLRSVLAAGVDVSYPWMNPDQPSVKDGCTALSEAISLNHIEAAKALIEANACALYVDRNGWLILQKAAYHGRDVIVRMLINAGLSPRISDNEGNTPLHVCSKNGFVHNNPRCILAILQCGAAPNAKNKKGFIALHFIATWGMSEMASILIDWKSYTDTVDNDYLTPFYVAIASVILQQRKKPSILMQEVFARQLPVMKTLLNKGGCDSLGFAAWFASQRCLHNVNDPEFLTWWKANYPENLKHLCRVFIQNWLGFTTIRHNYCIRKIRKFEIPETLKEYLSRRIISM